MFVFSWFYSVKAIPKEKSTPAPPVRATGYFALGQAAARSINRGRLAKLGTVLPELARLEDAKRCDDAGD